MMATLNGNPLMSLEGLRKMEEMNAKVLSPRVLLKSAISTVPTMVVVIQVRTNRMTFTQGNGREDSSANSSAG